MIKLNAFLCTHVHVLAVKLMAVLAKEIFDTLRKRKIKDRGQCMKTALSLLITLSYNDYNKSLR